MFPEAHFPSAENNIDFNLVSAIQKFKHVAHLNLKVVFTGKRSQLDFLGLYSVNRCFFLLFFALLILEFSIIHQPAYRRVSIGGNLNKIESLFRGYGLGLLICYNAELISFTVDNPQQWSLDGCINRGLAGIIFLVYGRILRMI